MLETKKQSMPIFISMKNKTPWLACQLKLKKSLVGLLICTLAPAWVQQSSANESESPGGAAERDRLSLDAMAEAVAAGNFKLANAMLDAGAGRPSPDQKNTEDRDKALDKAIESAALQKNTAMLDRLLDLRPSGSQMSGNELGILYRILRKGRIDALELLSKRGWEINKDIAEFAINSMRPEVIQYALKTTGKKIEDFCMFGKLNPIDYKPLAEAIKDYPPEKWQKLLNTGIANIKFCDEDLRNIFEDPKDRKTLNIIGVDFFTKPFSMVGQRKEYIPQRITQLRQAGMEAADFSQTSLGHLVTYLSNGTTHQKLISALGPPPLNAPRSSDQNQNLPANLVGTYKAGEAGGYFNAKLELHPNGRFHSSLFMFMVTGGVERNSAGKWEVLDNKLVLTSDSQTPHTWFKITQKSQYTSGSDIGQPLVIKFENLGDDDFIRVEVHGENGEYKELKSHENEFEALLKSKPKTLAVSSFKTGASDAYEIALPDIPRLKSITVEFTPPPKPINMPFNATGEFDAEKLRIEGVNYKKTQ